MRREFLSLASAIALSVAVTASGFVSDASASNASPKRGFGGGNSSWITGTNSSWYYNWGKNPLDDPGLSSEFVPMFWSGGAVNNNNINEIANDASVDYLLGFNEPERSNQANMTVANALTKWDQFDDTLSAAGKTLVSPAVSDNAEGKLWIQDFMAQADAQGLIVDEVAFHWYGTVNPNNPTGSANSFLNRVDWYHNQFNRPVWITEFGGIDWGNNYDTATMNQANATFLNTVLAGLDSRSYVTRYAWWNHNNDTRLLSQTNPTNPTTAGESWIETIYDAGESLNLAGLSTGDDVVYLRGAEITNTRGTSVNGVRHLDAMEGANTLTGTSPWGIGSGGWLRVRAGATLTKQGDNTVSIGNTEFVLGSDFVVEQGEVLLSEGNTYAASSTGAIIVEPNGTLLLQSTQSSPVPDVPVPVKLNGGTLYSRSAQQTVSGGIELVSDSVFRSNADLQVTTAITGTGKLIKQGPGSLRLSASNTYSGTTEVEEGTLWIDGRATRETHVAAGASVIGDGLISGLLTAAGTVSPGSSEQATGTITVRGDLSLTADATVVIDWLEEGVADLVDARGEVTLAGKLVAQAIGVDPAEGVALAVVTTTGTLVGTFDEFEAPEPTSPLTWAIAYDDSSVYLASVPTLAGDFNADGVVDAADYTTWRDARGETGLGRLADANLDQVIDADDLTVWRANYGRVLTLAPAVAVPEPTTLAALLVAALLTIPRKASRR